MVDVLGAIGVGLVVPSGFRVARLNDSSSNRLVSEAGLVISVGVLAVYRGDDIWAWSCWLDGAGGVETLSGDAGTLSRKFCLSDPDLYECLQASLDGACACVPEDGWCDG